MDTYAVVLYFDAVTDRKLKKIIENIALISGNNYMIDVNIPPHITIGSFLSDEADLLLEMVEVFSKSISAFEVEFEEIRAFEPRVLFASPNKEEYLERLNVLIHETFCNNFLPADNEYYTPAKWVPHCALAVRLDKEQFQKVVTRQIELPANAKVEKIALARCNPYKEIAVWEIS